MRTYNRAVRSTCRERDPRSSREGASLGFVLIILGAVSLMGVGLMNLSGADSIETSKSLSAVQAFWDAEAGLQRVKAIARKFSQSYESIGLYGSGAYAGTTAHGAFSVSVADDPAWFNPGNSTKTYIVMSSGTSKGGHNRVVATRASFESLLYGLFAGNELIIGGNVEITGDTGSNGKLEVKDSAYIYGDATAGPGESLPDSSHVAGTVGTASEPMTLDPIDPTAIADAQSNNNNASLPSAIFDSSNGKFEMDSGDSYALPSGTYYFDEMVMKGSAVLSVGGTVEVYIAGKLDLSGGTVANTTLNPDNLTFYQTVDDDFSFSGNSTLYAHIYAPEAQDASLSGDHDFHGTLIIGGKIDLSGDLNFVTTGGGSGGSSGGSFSAWELVSDGSL